MPYPPEPGWGKIWDLRTWANISIFLWKVIQRHILTWDNILKIGFFGPSRCVLSKNNEESTDHLLDSFYLSSNLWDKAMVLCRISN